MTHEYVPAGGRALRDWLREKDLSIAEFAKKHDLNRLRVQRAINGEIQKIPVSFAKDIETATNKAVPWDSWVPPDEVREERQREHSEAARQRHRVKRSEGA